MHICILFHTLHQYLIPVHHPQTLYPLSLINGSLDEAKTSLSTSSSTLGRNLTAHQSYTMVTGETLIIRWCPLAGVKHLAQSWSPGTVCQCRETTYSLVFDNSFSFLVQSLHFHSCSPFSFSHPPAPPPSPDSLHTCCHHLRAPTVPAALSKTGNVPRSDQHKPLPKHGSVQPRVRGAAGAAEARFCQQQLQQLQPFPQRFQLILPSCTSVWPVQQSVYHLR